MTSCCSNGRCIHCRRDLRWFVAGLSALALVSLSDNVDTGAGRPKSGLMASTVAPHLASIAQWISGEPQRPLR